MVLYGRFYTILICSGLNKYKTSFSLSHYLKHSHSTIDKKIKTYCLNNNLDYKNLKYGVTTVNGNYCTVGVI